MNIKIRLKKKVNIEYYDSDEIELDLEKYVAISCATEMGNAPVEAMKAQSIAIRTNAYYYSKKNQSITDGSPQAFNVSRDTSAYQNARDGTKATEGFVLYWGGSLAYPASFSAGNGGVTVSSKERWGGERPWLQGGKIDPWDYGNPSHGVGLAQRSASKQVQEGRTYKDVLSFFYDNTYLHNIYTGEEIPLTETEKKGVDDMSVKASEYLVLARKIAAERSKWRYELGHSEEYCADCAGLVKYILEQYGVKSYDGSNTQWRKYLTSNKGKISAVNVLPGILVFKRRDWTPDQSGNPYYGDSIGDMYHVGMYLGDGQVLEARGTNSGIVLSDLSIWTYAGQHKETVLDTGGEPAEPFIPFTGKVTTQSTNLNIRSTPNGTKIGSIPKGTVLTLTDQSGNWYETSYNGLDGWVSADYITPITAPKNTKDYTVYSVSEDFQAEFEAYLTEHRLSFVSKGGA